MGGMKVALLAGGRSGEREVSLRSGSQVRAALESCGHHVTVLDLGPELWPRLAIGGFDCVFIAFHGPPGEDGGVQGMLEVLDLPYTGSGVLASALCMDKAMANRVLVAAGLPVPPWTVLDAAAPNFDLGRNLETALAVTGLPAVCKPVRAGSTLGLTISANVDELADGVLLARRIDPRVMLQRCVRGVEVTVGLLGPGPTVLPVLEIVSENPVYDYDAKYTAGRSHHIIPARIPATAAAAAERSAAAAWHALGCEGFGRVDMIVDPEGIPWLLEMNTIPGLTEVSLLPDAARAAGIGFTQLCERLLEDALERHRRRPAR